MEDLLSTYRYWFQALFNLNKGGLGAEKSSQPGLWSSESQGHMPSSIEGNTAPDSILHPSYQLKNIISCVTRQFPLQKKESRQISLNLHKLTQITGCDPASDPGTATSSQPEASWPCNHGNCKGHNYCRLSGDVLTNQKLAHSPTPWPWHHVTGLVFLKL